jgi:hypothetical protein
MGPGEMSLCKRPRGKPRHVNNGMHCLAIKMSPVTTRSSVLWDPISKFGSGAVSGVFIYVIMYLGSPITGRGSRHAFTKKLSALAFLYYEPSTRSTRLSTLFEFSDRSARISEIVSEAMTGQGLPRILHGQRFRLFYRKWRLGSSRSSLDLPSWLS